MPNAKENKGQVTKWLGNNRKCQTGELRCSLMVRMVLLNRFLATSKVGHHCWHWQHLWRRPRGTSSHGKPHLPAAPNNPTLSLSTKKSMQGPNFVHLPSHGVEGCALRGTLIKDDAMALCTSPASSRRFMSKCSPKTRPPCCILAYPEVGLLGIL